VRGLIAFDYVILVLLGISIALNVILYVRVKQLSRQLKEVDARVEITKEELSQIRKRLERLKGEI
jgi:5-bromo-4-chloroindolyl phosphate hydrolysis protein